MLSNPVKILFLNTKQVKAYFIIILSGNNKKICTVSAICTSITIQNAKNT